MSDKSRAKLLLERWALGIKREDKRHENMPSLFDALASDLFAGGIDFEPAHDIMKTASKMMYPSAETVKHTFARGVAKKYSTIQEFTMKWHKTLDDSSLTAFYSYYDIEGVDPTRIPPTKKIAKTPQGGMVTEDVLNEEDFWKSTKSVTRESPWLFDEEEVDG